MKNSATLGFIRFVSRPARKIAQLLSCAKRFTGSASMTALEEHLRAEVAEIRRACHLHHDECMRGCGEHRREAGGRGHRVDCAACHDAQHGQQTGAAPLRYGASDDVERVLPGRNGQQHAADHEQREMLRAEDIHRRRFLLPISVSAVSSSGMHRMLLQPCERGVDRRPGTLAEPRLLPLVVLIGDLHQIHGHSELQPHLS